MSEALGVSEYDSDDIDSIRFDNPEESADIDENIEAFLEANFPQEMLEFLIRSFGPEIVKNEIYTILADYFERCEQLGVECSNEVMSIVTNCINDFGKGSEIEANANFAAGELMTESIKIHHNDETKMAEMLLLASCLRYEAEMKAQQYYRNRISASGSAGGYELENLIAAEKLRFFKGVTAVLRVTKGLEDLEQLKELVALVISVGRINPFGVEKIMHEVGIGNYRTIRYMLKLALHEGFPNAGLSHINNWLDINSLENVSDADLDKSLSVQVLKSAPDDLLKFLFSCGAKQKM